MPFFKLVVCNLLGQDPTRLLGIYYLCECTAEIGIQLTNFVVQKCGWKTITLYRSLCYFYLSTGNQ